MTEKMTSAGSWGRSGPARWAPVPLRLIVGYGFMQHGFAKMSRGPDAFAAILHALGVPAPHFTAWVSILTTVHLPNGFSSIKLIAVTAAGPQFGPVGYEVNVLYLACLAGLVLGGSGPFAVDDFFQRAR